MLGAALDIGSNSFICLVFESDEHGQIQTLQDKIVLTRLSESVDEKGQLSSEALARAEDAFKTFSAYFEKYRVQKILGVATSAARDAKNQKDLLDLAAKYKIPIKILTGNQEAQMTFLGVKKYFYEKSGLIIDIGGGSTEYISVSNGEIVQRTSLNLGVVRFSERFSTYDNYKAKEQDVSQAIQEQLKQSKVLQELKESSLDVVLAVSGTPTNIAALLLNQFNVNKIEGFELTQNKLEQLKPIYSYKTLEERQQDYPFVDDKRADVLPVGLAILQESMKFFNLDTLSVSTKGIRHGAAKILSNTDGTFF